MRWGRAQSSRQVDEENPYWMSFSDVMSGLVVIFILAAVLLIMQLMQLQDDAKEEKTRLQEKVVEIETEIEALRKAEKARRNILTEAARELQRRGIQVTVSENTTVLRIPNELLGFDTGEDEIQKQYEDVAEEIGLVLYNTITKENRTQYLDTIFVEGHTDIRPFNGSLCGDKGNWCLSAFRAISLWQYWQKALTDNKQLAGLTNAEGLPLFSVSGYAATRPVMEVQKTDKDFRRNRRIDIRLTIRRPSSTDYERVREQMEIEP